MKKILTLGYCVLLALLPFPGNSQNNDTLKINLPQALEIALSDNPTIVIADLELKRIDYSKQNAWLGLLPSLSGTAQYSKYVVPASMSMMGQVMDSPTDFNASLGVSLSLPLFAPALWRSIQMSALDMQMAAEKAYASKITLRNDVIKAYYNVLLTQDSYKSLQDGYNVARQNYEEAKKRFDLGMAAEYDYISAEVQMNNLLPALLQVETGITQTKLYLKVLMGVDRAVPLAVEGNLADFEAEVAASGTRNISLSGNADLRQLDIQQQQLYKSLQIQRTQWMPTLAAFGNYNYSGTGNRETTINFGGIPMAVPKSTEWYGQGLIVGLQLNVPIFNGSSNLIKTKQINLQRQELALQRDYLESSLSVQAHAALDNMDKAVKQMDAAKKSVTLSKKGYDISAKRYETGAGTMLELQNATLALTQSRLSYHQAIADYLNAKADYEKITGHK
ncbi:MAG: TolC family protein [Prevotellaceae bacterium]|jgi:outer membrane protein TolC|nr:TolC family protein [Prevotellaceae bacterium]